MITKLTITQLSTVFQSVILEENFYFYFSHSFFFFSTSIVALTLNYLNCIRAIYPYRGILENLRLYLKSHEHEVSDTLHTAVHKKRIIIAS